MEGCCWSDRSCIDSDMKGLEVGQKPFQAMWEGSGCRGDACSAAVANAALEWHTSSHGGGSQSALSSCIVDF